MTVIVSMLQLTPRYHTAGLSVLSNRSWKGVYVFFREELACRLPELEQENFDDSESRLSLSISSESLLEDRVRSLESEGQ